MYSPPVFRYSDADEIFDLMDRYPFATVVSVAAGRPVVSHLPLTPKRVGDSIELIGHMARANSQWRSFRDSPPTLIFNGPHTYITPRWYQENDVPTWNYASVHATGAVTLIEDLEGLVGCLKELTAHVERRWPSGWEFFMPDDLSGDILVKSIVGFRIRVEGVEYKKKMSQNRSPGDQALVIKGLSTRSDENSRLVRQEMEKLQR